jgi:hypothetical protein
MCDPAPLLAPGSGPDYQGEQDADPLNATDCDTASDQGTFLHAAEFEVFSQDVAG